MDRLQKDNAQKVTLSNVNGVVAQKLQTLLQEVNAPTSNRAEQKNTAFSKWLQTCLLVAEPAAEAGELPQIWQDWIDRVIFCVQQYLENATEANMEQVQQLQVELAGLMPHDLSSIQMHSVLETYLGELSIAEEPGTGGSPQIRIAEISQYAMGRVFGDRPSGAAAMGHFYFNDTGLLPEPEVDPTSHKVVDSRPLRDHSNAYDLVVVSTTQLQISGIEAALELAGNLLSAGGMLLFADWNSDFIGAQLLHRLHTGNQGLLSLAPEALTRYGFTDATRLFNDLQGGCRSLWLAQREAVAAEATVAERHTLLQNETPEHASMQMDAAQIREQVETRLTQCLAQAIDMDVADLDSATCFQDYGVDSLVSVTLVKKINAEFGSDLKTVDLFDYACLGELAAFVAENYGEDIAETLCSVAPLSTVEQGVAETSTIRIEDTSATETKAMALDEMATHLPRNQAEPIAIIGMSGRFAQSDNVDALWQHLAAGSDLISRAERWDLREGIPKERHAALCDQGSFVDNIDEFDPQFFNITATEANYMDPQQRIFLQQAWLALEEGGYAGDSLRGTTCGVYVGCHSGDYDNLFDERYSPAQSFWGNSGSVLPARIAYLLDLKGPALAIDTACSSSLVAIHTACMALRSGEVNYALAGGVFIQSTAEFYQYSNRAGMLSPRGRCHSFDARADGFVPGEGAGVILLKRLSDALADGDHIHGVIAGSACNQDGATNGITAPSANSQERLQRQVYDRYGINADSIQMVEAHGTGTMLGDPIEFQALTRSFRKDTSERNYCALGSIKSNLGHTATAAGVSGVLKILLAMKHQQMPPSLHFEQGNPNIDFDNSPFYVNTQLRDWPANRDGLPRRAAVSSFGFSGTNVHMVIDQGPQCERVSPARPGHLVVLSADSEAQLHTLVERHLAHLQSNPELDLGHLSYTLLQGRKHLNQRLACVVSDREQLRSQWQAFINKSEAGALRGDLKQNPWRNNHEAQQAAQQHLENAAGQDHNLVLDALQQLAQAYCAGCPLDWSALFTSNDHADQSYARLSLPGYPFARQRYWIGEQQMPAISATANSAITNNHAHPLIHSNESNFEQQQYRSVFTGDEVFLRDHKVRGDAVLPGVAYLEMAREAIQRSIGSRDGVLELCDVEWRAPITVSDTPVEIHTELQWQNEALHFSVRSADTLHSVGQAHWREAEETVLPLQELQAAMSAERSGEDCYQNFNTLGIHYGASHQCIERLWCGERAVLAQLRQTKPSHTGDYLDPGLLDSALQCAVGLMSDSQQLAIPRRLQSLAVFAAPTDSCWVWLRQTAQHDDHICLELDIADDAGRVLLQLKGVELHILGRRATEQPLAKNSKTESLLQFVPGWQNAATGARPADTLVVCDLPHFEGVFSNTHFQSHFLNSNATSGAAAFRVIAEKLQALLQEQLEAQPDSALMVLVPPALQGLIGFVRSVQQEYPHSQLQLLSVSEQADASVLINTFNNGLVGDYFRLSGKTLEAQQWQETSSQNITSTDNPWRDNGVYLITGGAGGLGLLFARYIAQQCQQPTLLLSGRRERPQGIEDILIEVAALGASVHYLCLDVSDTAAVQQAVADVQQQYGVLHGVLHCAGVLNDSLLPQKTADSLQRVLTPKVSGLENLDLATAQQPLDWFVACSSAAGALGNIGQSDYAAANAFMDAYITQRAQRVADRQCSGRSVSINWPLWAEGGMGLSDALREQLWQKTGLVPLPAATGLQILHNALLTTEPQQLVLFGDAQRLQSLVQKTPGITRETPKNISQQNSVQDDVYQREALEIITPVIARVTGLSADQLDETTGFDKLGLDSIMMVNITEQLSETFGELSKTLLYENQSMAELSAYLAENFRDHLAVEAASPVVAHESKKAAPPPHTTSHVKRSAEDNPAIAIVGLAGRYPQARSVEEFWQNLQQGRDCVSPLPQDRWRLEGDKHSALIDSIKNTYGGFIDGVDEFDPLFFNINPRDAEFIDPQERLFLQCVYETLEDAGYTRDSLAASCSNSASRFVPSAIGVYVGVMYEEYQMYGVQSTLQGNPVALGGNPASIANRISYYFDLHGPSMAVDTMCSSSITAIHLACEAIARGECEAAIAGGVNVSVHPNKYIFLNQGNFTSSDGRCASFGEGGDGYVPGEGVGAVLLKPLHKAEQDGDRIYGVVRGSSLNHGGKTSGYTVPHPNAQAEVIHRAYQRAGVEPRDVSYIEAHGTGTSLGDPIEIAGLNKAFAGVENTCAIGSVKSNIGHCESAAGIAGVTKVLLQMRERTLVPSLHSQQLNKHIDFEKTPFRVQRESAPWQPGENRSRIAGISSFGAGGSNAHLILEEYIAAEALSEASRPGPGIFLLSAATAEQLQEKAQQLLAFLETEVGRNAHLSDIAFTLAIGREALYERAIIRAQNRDEFTQALQALAQGHSHAALSGADKSLRDDFVKEFSSAAQRQQHIDAQLHEGDTSLAQSLWLAGMAVDWGALFSAYECTRIALPTYPFARERCWFETPAAQIPTASDSETFVYDSKNMSLATLKESYQPHTSRIAETDFFYRDHTINGRAMLPGAAYLELVRKALAEQLPLSSGKCLRFDNVLWRNPFEGKDVHSELVVSFEVVGDSLAFEINSERSRGENVPHCQGRASLCFAEQVNQPIAVTLDDDVGYIRLHSQTLYNMFAARNFVYGDTMRALTEVNIGEQQALAKLQLPNGATGEFGLHPALLDAAFQSVIGLLMQENLADNLAAIPVALASITVVQACPAAATVRIRSKSQGSDDAGVRLFDLQLLNERDQVCVAVEDFTVRLVEMAEHQNEQPNLYSPEWQLLTAGHTAGNALSQCGYLVIGSEHTSTDLAQQLQQQPATAWLQSMVVPAEPCVEDYHQGFIKTLQSVRALLLQEITVDHLFIVLTPDCSPHWLALTALLQSAHWENPAFSGSVIQILDGALDRFVQDVTVAPGQLIGETALQYSCGEFRARRWQRKSNALVKAADYTREAGVYLITGGAGGLGKILARHLASTVAEVKLILTGRRQANEEIHALLDELDELGCEAEYVSCDISNAEATRQMIYRATQEFGQIDGIYHCAGTTRDEFIIQKSAEDALQVVSAKLDGVINLDRATGSMLLDFFVCFSSAAGITGNMGQGDYAFANAFMDSYMSWRGEQVKLGERYGKSVSINWPLWQSDGMSVSPEVLESMLQAGLTPLQEYQGLNALPRVIGGDAPQVAVLPEGFEKLLAMRVQPATNTVQNTDLAPVADGIRKAILDTVAHCVDVSVEELNAQETWQALGLETFTLNRLAKQLYETLSVSVSAAEIVEYETPENLIAHLTVTTDGLTAESNPPAASTETEQSLEAPAKGETRVMNTNIYAETKAFLIEVLSKELKLPARRLSDNEPFERYGIDSISAMRLTAALEAKYGSLSKTLFFQYTSINALATHLSEEFGTSASAPETTKETSANEASVKEALVKGKVVPANAPAPSVENAPVTAAKSAASSRIEKPAAQRVTAATSAVNSAATAAAKSAPTAETRNKAAVSQSGNNDIAIVGIAGRFPKANSVEQFWELLAQGEDCVTEIPEDRWSMESFFNQSRDSKNTSYSKWGAFISNVDKFDASFFNLSPRDAIFMDPQERLFLEVVWELLESAGCTPQKIQHQYQHAVGLYAGAMYQQYRNIQSDAQANAITSVGSYSSMVNRVSHFFDFRGPSVAVDTMCSTAVTCLRMACEDLLRGDTKVAVAGAANLSLHENKYIGLSQGQMLGGHRGSRGFAEGDGYIPAECVGAVMLKRRADAEADGDNILGIIKSIAINHSGRTNAYSVPSLSAQRDVINTCLQQAGLAPESIHCVESAVNGSALGDPIEMAALSAVFGAQPRPEKIALGSVKTNIGHGEAASGISQLAKVLMQYRHNELAPSVFVGNENPNLGLNEQTFNLVRESASWEASADQPRRTLVTSFGAGGSNSAMIIEDYAVQAQPQQSLASLDEKQVLVFSAQTPQRLQALLKKHLAYLDANSGSLALQRYAHSLQTGRAAMDTRLAFGANSLAEVREQLRLLVAMESIERDQLARHISYEELHEGTSDIENLLSGSIGDMVVEQLIQSRDCEKLAEFWCKGFAVDWNRLYNNNPAFLFDLPSYPFAKNRYWLEAQEVAQSQPSAQPQPVIQRETTQLSPVTSDKNAPQTLADHVRSYIVNFIATELRMSATEINTDANITRFGVDSITLMRFVRTLNEQFGVKVSVKDLSHITSVRQFTDYICQLDNAEKIAQQSSDENHVEHGRELDEMLELALQNYQESEQDFDELIEMVDSL